MRDYAQRTSYKDWLDLGPDDEAPHPTVIRVCEELERQGWTCTSIRAGRGLRYLCPDDTDKHAGIWISLTFVPQEFIDSTAARTCLKHFLIAD